MKTNLSWTWWRGGDSRLFGICHLSLVILLVLLVGEARGQAGERVFYLNSYHEGYGSSDQVMAGIKEGLSNRVELRTYFLDSKRQPAASAIESNAVAALRAIRQYRPRVLIASDDDAVKYVVARHFKEGPVPVVFCGVNWSCEQYGLPTSFVTGMIEVVPIEEAVRVMKRYYPAIRQLAVLSEDSTSERSNRELLDPLYRRLGLEPSYWLTGDFDSWKKAFDQVNGSADLIYLPTHGAIRGWDKEAAAAWVRQRIRKPVFTCDDFMMPYSVLGITKVAREQGDWAAQTTLRILAGQSPAQIPLATNQQIRCYFNPGLAGRVGFRPDKDLRDRCQEAE